MVAAMASQMFIILWICSMVMLAVSGKVSHLDGKCPNYVPMKGYDVQKDGGMWYPTYIMVAGRDPPPPMKCRKDNKEMQPNGNFIVHGEFMNLNNEKVTCTVTGTKIITGKWKLKDSLSKEFNLDETATLLYTDYKNFKAIVKCTEYTDGKHAYVAVILSRKCSISSEYLTKALKTLRDAGIVAPLQEVAQTHC